MRYVLLKAEKKSPVEDADGALTPTGIATVTQYATDWVGKHARNMDLELRYPELKGIFFDVRHDVGLARDYVGKSFQKQPERFILRKAGGPYIGPRGGKWADPEHTISWQEPGASIGLPVHLKVPYKPMAGSAFKAEMDRRRHEGLELKGDTYKWKEVIKEAGGVWDKYEKYWLMPTAEHKAWLKTAMQGNIAPDKMAVSAFRGTEKQINLAHDLVQRAVQTGIWKTSFMGAAGAEPPTREHLAQWEKDEISALLDELCGMVPRLPVAAIPVSETVKPGVPAESVTEKEKVSPPPAPPTAKPTSLSLYGGSGYGAREFKVGQVIQTTESQREKGMPKWVTVVSATKSYFKEDGLSVGVGDDSGYIYSAKVRAATPEEVAPMEKKKAEAAQVREYKQQVIDIAKTIDTEGDYVTPPGPRGIEVEGDRLFDTQDIYGGGSWFVITPEYIWHVRNNGADGGNWAQNNVSTSGAGAIGRRIPRDEVLVEKLYKLHKILKPGDKS